MVNDRTLFKVGTLCVRICWLVVKRLLKQRKKEVIFAIEKKLALYFKVTQLNLI